MEDAVVAKATEIPEHVKLDQAVKEERQNRAKRVMAHIEQYCRENNCLFIAIPQLVEVPGDGWIISAKPGVNPL